MILYSSITDNGSKILVNRISETAAYYLDRLELTAFDQEELSKYLTDKRKLQWYASRYTLKQLLNLNEVIFLQKDSFGKPRVENSDINISISHTQHMVAAMSNDQYSIGVDVEEIKDKVIRIAPKFTTEKECSLMSKEHEKELLITIWSAKESIYKMYSQKQLDFKDHILLEPFIYKGKGQFKAVLSKDDLYKELVVNYLSIEDHILTYVEDVH